MSNRDRGLRPLQRTAEDDCEHRTRAVIGSLVRWGFMGHLAEPSRADWLISRSCGAAQRIRFRLPAQFAAAIKRVTPHDQIRRTPAT
jgi:hypothetical protein